MSVTAARGKSTDPLENPMCGSQSLEPIPGGPRRQKGTACYSKHRTQLPAWVLSLLGTSGTEGGHCHLASPGQREPGRSERNEAAQPSGGQGLGGTDRQHLGRAWDRWQHAHSPPSCPGWQKGGRVRGAY